MELSLDITAAAAQIRALDRRSPLDIGRALLELRPQIAHGAWLPFLAECAISDQTALNYMQVARQVEAVPELAGMLPSYLYSGVRYTKKGFRGETTLRHAIAANLREQGAVVREQVATAAGIADIVTDSAVYEVKFFLSRLVIFEAIGQVLLYRQALNPSLRAIVVGFRDPRSDIASLVPYAKQATVEVMFWGDE
jgi:hypothetical protein